MLSQPIFSKIQILKLGDIFTLKIGKIMYKIHNKSSNISSFRKLTLINQIYTYHTRSPDQENYFFNQSKYNTRSLGFLGAKI